MGSTLRTTTSAAPGEKRTCPPLDSDSVAAPPEKAVEGTTADGSEPLFRSMRTAESRATRVLCSPLGYETSTWSGGRIVSADAEVASRRCGTTENLRLPASDLSDGCGRDFLAFPDCV